MMGKTAKTTAKSTRTFLSAPNVACRERVPVAGPCPAPGYEDD
jgi:hypothetical protein